MEHHTKASSLGPTAPEMGPSLFLAWLRPGLVPPAPHDLTLEQPPPQVKSTAVLDLLLTFWALNNFESGGGWPDAPAPAVTKARPLGFQGPHRGAEAATASRRCHSTANS